MPVALSGIIAATLGASAVGVALQTVLATATIFGATALGGTILSIGLSLGASFLAASLFKPQQPKPEDGQASTRQPLQPRVRHYGRVKVSGAWIFAEAKDGSFDKVISLGEGPVDAIEEYWVDQTKVTLDTNGDVLTNPWYDGGRRNLTLESRLGAIPETAYSYLVNEYGKYTTAHRGDGIASLRAHQDAMGQSRFLELFPQGINTHYRVVLRGSRVGNPAVSGGALTWRDNAAAVIKDYMLHPDGMRIPSFAVNSPEALQGWATAQTISTEAIPLLAGGTEPRWRLWGSYNYTEKPANVLGRMLAACDGRITPTPDGGITLDVSQPPAEPFVVDSSAIVGFTDVRRGNAILSTANVIKATYTNPDGDYQAADADQWIDQPSVDDRGEIIRTAEFNMAPSHSQCRRLMKREAYRANPAWVGTFECNLKAIPAFGERFVRIRYPELTIDRIFEVEDFKFKIGAGNILQGVTIQVSATADEAYAWTPAEEGTSPSVDPGLDDFPDVPPVQVTFGGNHPETGDPLDPYQAVMTFPVSEAPAAFVYRAAYKETSSGTWIVSDTLEVDATFFVTPALTPNTSYDFALYYERNADQQLSPLGPVTTDTTPV